MPRPYKALRRQSYRGDLLPVCAATTAMLSENTQREFYGRGVPRPYKALQKQGYKHYFTALTGRTRIAIIHPKTSLSVIAGEACLAPTKPCGVKAIDVILLPLQGAHELRLFIPKHHCRLLRARRAAPYGGGSITACHGAPLQPQCYLKIRSAHLMGEACLARRVMTCIIRIACDYFMA